MDNEPQITLDIPDPDSFEDDTPSTYIPLPSAFVDPAIELLQCLIAQWKHDEGSAPDEEVWDRLVVSAAQMLSALLSAWTAYYHRGAARELIDQIKWFCHWDDVPSRLDAVRNTPTRVHPAFRTDLEDADVVAALLSLHELSARRLAERKGQHATAEQGPTAVGDPGWEF
jgi:hypothetical protein